MLTFVELDCVAQIFCLDSRKDGSLCREKHVCILRWNEEANFLDYYPSISDRLIPPLTPVQKVFNCSVSQTWEGVFLSFLSSMEASTHGSIFDFEEQL